MKFGKWFCAMMALAMAGSVAVPAQAGNRAGALTLSPMVGGYMFEGDQPVEQDELTYGVGIGYNITNNFAVEFLGQTTDGELEFAPKADTDTSNFSLNALYHIGSMKSFAPYVTVGAGVMKLAVQGFGDNDNLAGNYGLGAKVFLSENVALRLDARHYIGLGDDNFDELNDTDNNLSYMAGLTFQTPAPAAPAPKDADGDGVIDSLDKCPDTPKGVQVDANGCPLDSDGDGVPDYLDKCRGTEKGVKVDANGCPVFNDADKDGVIDEMDKCPGTPAGVKVDANGCPVDSDGDGVADYLDKCPDTPKGAKVDAAGCPLDSDGDGVADYLDKCPNTLKGVMVDETGCAVSLTLKINFDYDKADIKPSFQGELKKAADFIAKYPGNKILVAGHTDSKGTDAYNQKLSERRAKAVREYLVGKLGVAADKLVARGYGETQPVGDNATAEGQAKNRRVEVICCTVIPD